MSIPRITVTGKVAEENPNGTEKNEQDTHTLGPAPPVRQTPRIRGQSAPCGGSRALWGDEQLPWPLPTRRQEHPSQDGHTCPQTGPSTPGGQSSPRAPMTLTCVPGDTATSVPSMVPAALLANKTAPFSHKGPFPTAARDGETRQRLPHTSEGMRTAWEDRK